VFGVWVEAATWRRPGIVGWHDNGPGLAAELAAELEYAIAELLALVVVHELVSEALLELRQVLLFGGWCAVTELALESVVSTVFSPFLWAGSREMAVSAGPIL
jgi:hypothetical protein